MVKKDFIKEVLEDPKTFGNFEITDYSQSEYDKKENNIWYGKAKDRTGMTVIHWCTKGHFCTYFSEELEPNISVSIGKDGNTRLAFNGYCFNKEDFKRTLKMTW